MSLRVVVVEDDARLRATITRGLREEGVDVVGAVGTGADLLRQIPGLASDVLVLDVGLPDCDGRDLCSALRGAGIDTPVLFLTALDGVSDRLAGFHAGGDDYLPKPFSFAELVLRVTALGRRHVRTSAPAQRLELDPGTHSARRGDRAVALTPIEYRLLSALLARRGEVVRRRSVVAAAWPNGALVQDNTLDAYVARLRRKLRTLNEDADPAPSGEAAAATHSTAAEPADAAIEVVTVRGVGYRVQ